MADDYDDDLRAEGITCHSYTHARRYPLVIGKVGGFALPTPLSPAQIGMLLGSFFVMLTTRRIWGALLPGMLNGVLLVVVPAALTWAIRHLRMEGRSPFKMLVGQLSYLAAPRDGWARGQQRWLRPGPVRLSQPIVIVSDTELDRPLQPTRSAPPVTADRTALQELRPTARWAALEEVA